LYTAQSIIEALKDANELLCDGIDSLGCPSPLPHDGCKGVPANCDRCKSKLCKQPVSVHQNYKKLIVLNFRFMISITDYNGFIRKDDSSLNMLISRKLIDAGTLKAVVV
jgi:hypothetical protein